jgi:uncharacterized membrane protein
MVRFFNKNELIIILLVILLFDLNGFCDIASDHILYVDKRAFFSLFLALIFLLFDIYFYTSLINSEPLTYTTYKNNKKRDLTCEEHVDDQVEDLNMHIDKIQKSCTAKINNSGHVISSKLVLGFTNLVLVIMLIACITHSGSGNENSNTLTYRILLSIPVILLICSVSLCLVFA